MKIVSPKSARNCALLATVLLAGPWGILASQPAIAPAQTDPGSIDGASYEAAAPPNRFNQLPTIDIQLNRTWGKTPLEIAVTVSVSDHERDRLSCGVRFDFDNDVTIAQRLQVLFEDGSPQVSVRKHLYREGEGVRHIRVFCRDMNNQNGLSTADAFVTLNPCDGEGFNSCGTCGDLPPLPCDSGDLACEAQVVAVCSPVCGDGAVTGSEVCDGPIVPAENCGTLGLGRGSVQCTSDCQGFDGADCSQAPSCPDTYPEPAAHILIPEPPNHVHAAAEGCRRIRVAWRYNATSQSTSSRVPGLSGFRVYRDGVFIAETTGRETCSRNRNERAFIDDTVQSGATHTYEIAAINGSGQASEPTGQALVTVPGATSAQCMDTIAPPAPANLRRLDPGVDCRDTRVAVDGVSDVGTGVRGYRYYLDGADQCIEIGTQHVSGGLRLQYAQGLYPGASYDVQVTAVDHAGNESPRTPVLPVEVARCERVTEYRTVVVLVTYPDMPPPPLTPSEVEAEVFGPVGSLSAFYAENSHSTVAVTPAPGGGVTDWLVLPHDRLYYCDALQDNGAAGVGVYCDFELLRRDVNRLLGDSIDFTTIDRAIYAYYGSGGANSAVNLPIGESGLHMSTLVHETAHAWSGRLHARGLTCPPGHQVPPDPNDPDLGCVQSEYGDVFDPMGTGTGHFSAHNKIEMGLLSADALGFARQNGFYPVEQLALPSDGRKEIRVPLGADDLKHPAYSFEYRRPDGFDATMQIDGVIVRIVGPDVQRNLSTSNTAGRGERLVLNPGGQPFVDPYRKIQVSVHGKNAKRAVLHVCSGTPGS